MPRKADNLLGQTFDQLFVEKRDSGRKGKNAYWICKCTCGKTKSVSTSHLKTGWTRSCGCLQDQARRAKHKDLTGKTFEFLTVKSFHKSMYKNKKQNFYWNCICECGKEIVKSGAYLTAKKGKRKHCGCKAKDIADTCTRLMYNGYICGAREHNRSFKLTVEQFSELIKSDCYYCGSPPSKVFKIYGKKLNTFCHHGIDRLNNKLGYTLKNSVTCCSDCNYAKHTKTVEEFKQMVIRIYHNLKLENQ